MRRGLSRAEATSSPRAQAAGGEPRSGEPRPGIRDEATAPSAAQRPPPELHFPACPAARRRVGQWLRGAVGPDRRRATWPWGAWRGFLPSGPPPSSSCCFSAPLQPPLCCAATWRRATRDPSLVGGGAGDSGGGSRGEGVTAPQSPAAAPRGLLAGNTAALTVLGEGTAPTAGVKPGVCVEWKVS